MLLVRKVMLAIAVGTVMLAGPLVATADSVPESERPIVIPLHNWTGATINAALTGQILERMGYNVEYVAVAALASAIPVAEGELAFSPEIWDNNLGEAWPKLIESGEVIDLGSVGLDAREGWLYPKHVEELCPGMPDWDAFIGCADIFATAETIPNGRFLDYPSEWLSRGGDLIRNEGLPFDVVPSGSEGALVTEFLSAVERKAPLVMMFWAPHWMLFQHEFGWVEIPEDLVNAYSMQKPRVLMLGWPGMVDEWPAAHRFLLAFQINNSIQEYLMDEIDNNKRDLMEVTGEWLDENQDFWQPMVDEALAGS